MDLHNFFLHVASQLFAWIAFAQTIHPFTDFPQINLWSLFMSTTLVYLIMTFIPGVSEKEAEGEVDFFDDYENWRDNGYMDAWGDDYDD